MIFDYIIESPLINFNKVNDLSLDNILLRNDNAENPSLAKLLEFIKINIQVLYGYKINKIFLLTIPNFRNYELSMIAMVNIKEQNKTIIFVNDNDFINFLTKINDNIHIFKL